MSWRPRGASQPTVVLKSLTSVGYSTLVPQGRDLRSNRVHFTCTRGSGDVVELLCVERDRDRVAAALRRASRPTTAGIGYREAAAAAARRNVGRPRGLVRWLLPPGRAEVADWTFGRSWWREPVLRVPFLRAAYTAAAVSITVEVFTLARWWPLEGPAAAWAPAVGLLLLLWSGYRAKRAYTLWTTAYAHPGRELRYVLTATPSCRSVLILFPATGADPPPLGLLPVNRRAVEAHRPPSPARSPSTSGPARARSPYPASAGSHSGPPDPCSRPRPTPSAGS